MIKVSKTYQNGHIRIYTIKSASYGYNGSGVLRDELIINTVEDGNIAICRRDDENLFQQIVNSGIEIKIPTIPAI